MPKRELGQADFFKFGMVLYAIIALSGTWGIVLDWSLIPLWAKISRVAGNIFAYGITYFFYFLWGMFKAQAGTALSNNDLTKLLEDGNNEGK